MKKRMLSLTMAVLLIAALFAGCASDTAAPAGSTTAATTASQTTAAAPKTTAPASTAASAATTAAASDMSDIPNMKAPGILPIVVEPVTLTIGLVPATTVTDYNDNDFTEYLEEKTGIDIEFYMFPSEEPAQA